MITRAFWRVWMGLWFANLAVLTAAESAASEAVSMRVWFAEVAGGAIPLAEAVLGKESRWADAEGETLRGRLTEQTLTARFEERVVKLVPGKLVWVNATSALKEPANQKATLRGVTITVGGVKQEFRTRNVGVELGFVRRADRGDGVELKALVRRTAFNGFVDLGKSEAAAGGNALGGVRIPERSFQPVFGTTSREMALAMRRDEEVLIFEDWIETQSGEITRGRAALGADFIKNKERKRLLAFISLE